MPSKPAAPWRAATPETPFVLTPVVAPLHPHLHAHNPPAWAESFMRFVSHAPSPHRAALADPFCWRLGVGSVALVRAQSHAEKQAALEALSSLPVPWGPAVSSAREVELSAVSNAAFLYVPGEICRQADVLDACRASGLPVCLERGAFLPPSDMILAAGKLRGEGEDTILLVDAGSVNGYGDRVLDPRALWMLKETRLPIGINLGALLVPPNAIYQWKARWLSDARFAEPLCLTARALGSVCYVMPGGAPPSEATP